jgi:alkanesulfonate monooxygenase SsuD/methylene tetrahydromethanopterin reductase-like flavin-dependent oxidoreductase (luciferase family)
MVGSQSIRTSETLIEESGDMEFGFGLPTRGPLSSPEHLVTLAQRGEEMGFNIISVSDHVVIPTSIHSICIKVTLKGF